MHFLFYLCFVMFWSFSALFFLFSVLFVFCQIASYLFSFSCTHCVYTCCDYVHLFPVCYHIYAPILFNFCSRHHWKWGLSLHDVFEILTKVELKPISPFNNSHIQVNECNTNWKKKDSIWTAVSYCCALWWLNNAKIKMHFRIDKYFDWISDRVGTVLPFHASV